MTHNGSRRSLGARTLLAIPVEQTSDIQYEEDDICQWIGDAPCHQPERCRSKSTSQTTYSNFQRMTRTLARKHSKLIQRICCSNWSVAEWGDVFGDAVVATAILDRLLHPSHIIMATATASRKSTAAACSASQHRHQIRTDESSAYVERWVSSSWHKRVSLDNTCPLQGVNSKQEANFDAV